MSPVTVLPVEGLGEVHPGDDLAELLLDALGSDSLADGDVLVVTSKVVSKAEQGAVRAERSDLLADETQRVVARRGGTVVVRTRHGLVLAGAGIDASNTPPGTVLALPRDPDASARAIRERLATAPGRNVAVVVSDTAGRAWRNGQTDLAIGAAGLVVLDDHAGRTDPYGNRLAVTAPAVADEVAAAADLVKGKLTRCPAAVVRGLARLVLAPGEPGPGAAALVRPETDDMFGYGARDAVLRAAGGARADLAGFGRPAAVQEAANVLGEAAGTPVGIRGDEVVVPLPADPRAAGRLEGTVSAVAFALGWLPAEGHGDDSTAVLRFRSATP